VGLTDVMSVGEVNDEGVPLDTTVNEIVHGSWSSCPAKSIVNPIGIDDLTENKKDEHFENSIQAYVQYPKELKQKEKKIVMKIISHAWRRYKRKLVKIWRDQDTPFHKYKDLTKDDWVRFIEKCESEHFDVESQYMQ
jgi:hypothetical protein